MNTTMVVCRKCGGYGMIENYRPDKPLICPVCDTDDTAEVVTDQKERAAALLDFIEQEIIQGHARSLILLGLLKEIADATTESDEELLETPVGKYVI